MKREDKSGICNDLSMLFLLTLHFNTETVSGLPPAAWAISHSSCGNVEKEGIISGSEVERKKFKRKREGKTKEKAKTFSACECYSCPTWGSTS